jgi:hypothetical protein
LQKKFKTVCGRIKIVFVYFELPYKRRDLIMVIIAMMGANIEKNERGTAIMGQIKQIKNAGGGLIVCMLLVLVAGGLSAVAQEQSSTPVFKQEELEQMLAPIALYPDSLLSQILMASTYPLEVVQAQRWAQQNKTLRGLELATALEGRSWDPSVKSLVDFPDVLDMMNDKLDWMQSLGDAFLAQPKDVMNAVQALRKKAQDQGSLKTTQQQTVNDSNQIIVIEAANPEVIYVPAYDPTVVYGYWPYPAYPPYYWYPPWYVRATPYAFGAGVAMGAAWGYAWGHCDWHGGDIDIDINRNANFNRNINRGNYVSHYQGDGQFGQNGRGTWQHNPADRRGVPYRDPATAQRYNRGASANAVQSREAYRGRAEQASQDISRGGLNQMDNRAGNVQRPNASQRPAGRDVSSSNVSNQGGAFQGMDSGSAARVSSNRGQTSRQSMPARSSGGGGGARGGGGGGGRR